MPVSSLVERSGFDLRTHLLWLQAGLAAGAHGRLRAMSAKAPQTTALATDSRPPLVFLLVPLLFLAVHLRALDYPFVWTDQGEIVTGLMIRPLETWPRILSEPMVVGFDEAGVEAPRYYRPLQVLALSAVDEVFGRVPAHFRALNFALGAVTAWLLAWIVFTMMRDRVAGLLAGAVYAVHPANLENHVWIAGLSHALAAFFLAVSLLAGIQYQRAPRVPLVIVSVLALMLAVLSKEVAVVAPAMLFVASIALASQSPTALSTRSFAGIPVPPRHALRLVLAQCVVVLLYVVWLRPAVLGGALGGDSPVAGSWSIHIPTALGHWLDTLGWLVLPLSSNSSDVVRIMDSLLRAPVLGALFLLATSIFVWWRFASGTTAWVALGLAWVWLAFAPTSGLLPINHLRGERYVSLSLFGVAVLLPALLRSFSQWVGTPRARRVAIVVCATVVVAWAQRSVTRLPDWRSERALFEADIAGDPLYREGYLQLARLDVREGNFRGAKEHLERLRALGPAFAGHTSFLDPTQVIAMYCGINLELGYPEDSLDYFDRLTAGNPLVESSPVVAHCGAMSLLEAGSWQRAVPVLEALYRQGGGYATDEVAVEIAFAYARAGRGEDARAWLARLSDLPADPKVALKVARARALVEANAGD